METNLPTFLVIGAAKSGTTSLHFHLQSHPEVYVPKMNEPNFFAHKENGPSKNIFEEEVPNLFPVRSVGEYHKLFAGAQNSRAAGEVSPLYLTSEVAPFRIREIVPDVKLIAILRNPVRASISDHLMYLRAGWDTRSFAEIASNPEIEHSIVVYQYAKSIRRYFELFKREQIKVLLFEEFKAEPERVIAELYRFIGVDSSFKPNLSEVYNRGGIPGNKLLQLLFKDNPLNAYWRKLVPYRARRFGRKVIDRFFIKYPEVDDDIVERLKRYYSSDIEELSSLTGLDFELWR